MNLVFFDIDGTLLLSQGAGGRSITKVMREVFGIVGEIARVEIHGQTDRGIATNLFRAHGIEDTDDNWSQFTEAYLEVLDEELASSDGWLLPGFPHLLEELTRQKSRIEMALLTGNMARGARKKVDYFGVGGFFTWGGFGDLHRDRSDLARSTMEMAKSRIKSEPLDEVFVIGDTPNDIRCGKAISAKTIGVATAGYTFEQLQACEPDYVFRDLSDVEAMVSILSGQTEAMGPGQT